MNWQAQRVAQKAALEGQAQKTKAILEKQIARRQADAARDEVRFGLDLERQKILTGIVGIKREMDLQPTWDRRRKMEIDQGADKAERDMADEWQALHDYNATLTRFERGLNAMSTLL